VRVLITTAPHLGSKRKVVCSRRTYRFVGSRLEILPEKKSAGRGMWRDDEGIEEGERVWM
jgi:hypothetical protein